MELNSMNLEELKEYMVSIGEKAFRGEQIFQAFNKHGVEDIQDIRIIPEKLRLNLSQRDKVNITTIKELQAYAESIMGKPEPIEKSKRVIGLSEYRDGSILDYIYAVK